MKVPSLIFIEAAESSNSLVSTLSLQPRKDLAPRVPKRKPSRDLIKERSSKQQSDNSTANVRFDDGCSSQSLAPTTVTMSSLIDGLGRLSPLARNPMTPIQISSHLTTKCDTPPTIPQRDSSRESYSSSLTKETNENILSHMKLAAELDMNFLDKISYHSIESRRSKSTRSNRSILACPTQLICQSRHDMRQH
ncbi:unnamed protein product [Cylindrotheca closterium]|uniref:Uncharacterized protein n=1 Tax=Cylindrotheca closterium TaxID=2856 RepID=A0AAD2FXK3_9STRA|nr:unnamed protein product [Cylindrotheca closterium]